MWPRAFAIAGVLGLSAQAALSADPPLKIVCIADKESVCESWKKSGPLTAGKENRYDLYLPSLDHFASWRLGEVTERACGVRSTQPNQAMELQRALGMPGESMVIVGVRCRK